MSLVYKLIIAYDGTNYGGWQTQPNAPSIQSHIEEVLKTVLRHPLSITGSGRTDAGVHALAQVAHFHFDHEIAVKRTLLSLNALLPPDIRIRDIQLAPTHFHARFSAKAKIYHYHIHLGASRDPFKRLYSYHPRYKVDLELLKKAAKYFIGTHDFSSFANEAHKGSASKDAIRTIYRLDIIEEEGGIRLEFEGNGFLYKMVRNSVGTLLDIAKGKIPIESLPSIFEAKDRRKAGKSAPPQGLFLIEVKY